MEGDPGEGIYRAMIEENGVPRLAASATTLGIRKGKDIIADQADRVHRPAFQPRGKNGLSCSRTIASLPDFALPVQWGGSNPKVEDTMNLKDEFLTALCGEEDYDALLELVHRHQAQGLSSPEAYEILHRIWLEFSFDKVEEDSRLQNDLEYVMEKIWYECPAPER